MLTQLHAEKYNQLKLNISFKIPTNLLNSSNKDLLLKKTPSFNEQIIHGDNKIQGTPLRQLIEEVKEIEKFSKVENKFLHKSNFSLESMGEYLFFLSPVIAVIAMFLMKRRI